MTQVTILRNKLTDLCLMLIIMASETTVPVIGILVSKMLAIGSPGNFHGRPYIIHICFKQVLPGHNQKFAVFFDIGAAVTLLVFWRVEAPAILIAVAAGGLLQTVGLMAVTTVWQISVHGAAAAALATLVGLGLGTAPGVLAAVMLGLVGWARIRLDRHTPAQVVAGAFVGLAAVLISTHGILW